LGAQRLSATTADTCSARSDTGCPARLHARSGVHLGPADESPGATEVHDANDHDDHHDGASDGAHVADQSDLADGIGADDRRRPRRARAVASDHCDVHLIVDADDDPDDAKSRGHAHLRGARGFAAAAVTVARRRPRYTGVP
jgi:hypothetical protein